MRRGKLEMLRWIKCEQEGDIPSGRDSHSATLANNNIWIFGGQDQDENLLDDFYRATLAQGTQKVTIKLDDGSQHEIQDRTFKVIWKKISLRQDDVDPTRRVPWPIKRSSHTVNFYMSRYLVLIGGETVNQDAQGDT